MPLARDAWLVATYQSGKIPHQFVAYESRCDVSTAKDTAAVAWAIGLTTGKLPRWLLRDPDVQEAFEREHLGPAVQAVAEIAATMRPYIREGLLREELLWRYPSSHSAQCHRRQRRLR